VVEDLVGVGIADTASPDITCAENTGSR
jgi:hypothetical protein